MLRQIKGYVVTEEMVNEFIREAERMIETYGWQERTVMPYSFQMKITKIINELKDYNLCERGSKEYLISLANGLVPIMNKWEEYEHQPKIRVRLLKSGKEVELREEVAQIFIKEGLCIRMTE